MLLTRRFKIMYQFLWIGMPMLLVGCATTEPMPQEIGRVCNSNGCSETNLHTGTPETKAGLTPQQQAQKDQLVALAEQEPSAAYDLALRYLRGDGVVQNDYEFVQWLRNAGKRGHENAQKALGRLYLVGLSEMGSDANEAVKWLTITASRGDKESQKLLPKARQMQKVQRANYRWQKYYQEYYHPYWYTNLRYNWYWYNNRWAVNPYYRTININVPDIDAPDINLVPVTDMPE